MNFQTGSDYPVEIWQVSNPNFSTTVWINFQTGSDYPIVIWQVSNPNFSPTVWTNFQTGFDYPIAIRLSVKSQFFPDRLHEFQTGSEYPIAIWQMSNPKLPPTCLDSGFPNRWTTQFEIWIISKPQITPNVFGLRISKPLDHPIWDLDNLQIPNYPRRVWTQDFQTVGPPNLRFG